MANGKVLLAFAGAPIPDGPLPRYTARTITTRKALEQELLRIRTLGWASNVGEAEDGLHAVAAPVHDAFDRCCAALSVSGPSFRLPPRKLPDLAGRCAQAAKEIGRRLGRTR